MEFGNWSHQNEYREVLSYNVHAMLKVLCHVRCNNRRHTGSDPVGPACGGWCRRWVVWRWMYCEECYTLSNRLIGYGSVKYGSCTSLMAAGLPNMAQCLSTDENGHGGLAC